MLCTLTATHLTLMCAYTHIWLSEPLGCLIKQAGINIHTIPNMLIYVGNTGNQTRYNWLMKVQTLPFRHMLSLNLSVDLSVCKYVCLYVCMSVSMYGPVCLSVGPVSEGRVARTVSTVSHDKVKDSRKQVLGLTKKSCHFIMYFPFK